MVKKATTKPKISIRHLEKYVEELRSIGVPRERCSPLLLPDYRGESFTKIS